MVGEKDSLQHVQKLLRPQKLLAWPELHIHMPDSEGLRTWREKNSMMTEPSSGCLLVWHPHPRASPYPSLVVAGARCGCGKL